MATVRISQLTAITTPTDDDILIINDADTNTRKITYANLTQGLLNTSATAQTKNGALTVQGALTVGGSFTVDTNTFFVDSVNNRVGVKTTSPDVEFDIDGTARVRNAGSVQFGDANNSNWVALKSPAVIASNFTLTLPSSLPSATNLLTTNSAGTVGYSTGVTYDTTEDSLDLGVIKLTDQGSLRFFEETANGSDYIQLRAPVSLTTTNSYTLPSALPAVAGYVLSSDLSGNLSWITSSSGAAGGSAQIQYNDGAGFLSADADFTFQPGTNTMSVPNATVTTLLDAQGDVNLGNAATDTVTITGVIDSNIVPDNNTRTLGSASTSWGSAYIADLHVTANVLTDLIPDAGTEDLGSAANRWAEVHANSHFVGTISKTFTDSQSAVATAATFQSTLGAVATYGSFKVLVHVRDAVNDDSEFFEYLVTHDGTTILGAKGSNVESPTGGVFLATPTVSISGGNAILTLTNSAASTNNINIKLQITAIAI